MKNLVAQTQSEQETSLRVQSEAEIIQFADKLIAATPIEKEQLISLYGAETNKVEIIPPGVDINRFKLLPKDEARNKIGVAPDHKMILFVGRIQPLKGIDTLIRSIALVRRDQPALTEKLCISIIGGNPGSEVDDEQTEFQRLNALKEELGLGDLVTFLGAKDQDTLVNYYSAAEVVVMPSHYESFGMVALEAMACGTPVIASDVGGLTYVVEDNFNGYLVPSQDYAAMAEKITLLLRYPSLRDHLGDQARRWVERFSWSIIADDILRVYNKMIKENNCLMYI